MTSSETQYADWALATFRWTPQGTEMIVPINPVITKRAELLAEIDLGARLPSICGRGMKSIFVFGKSPDENKPRLALVVDDLFSSDPNQFRLAVEDVLKSAHEDATAEQEEEVEMMKSWVKKLLGQED